MVKSAVPKLTPTIVFGICKSDFSPTNWTQNTKIGDIFIIQSGQSFIQIKEFSYPKLEIKLLSSEVSVSYDLGGIEQFKILIVPNQVKITTPHFGQLQLFYFQTADWLYGADSFAALVEILKPQHQLQLNPEGILDWLTLDFNLTQRTIFQGIKKLAENQQLIWLGETEAKIVAAKKLADLLVPFASFSKSRFSQDFEKNLTSEYKNILDLVSPSSWGAGLSGGTDSAITSLLAQRFLPTQAVSVLVQPESEKIRQLSVINKITSKLNLKVEKIEAEEIPLLDDLNQFLLADPYLDQFANWSFVLGQFLVSQGQALVWTGMGADDFYHIRSSSLKLDEKLSSPVNQLLKPHQPRPKNITQRDQDSPLPTGLSNGLMFYNIPWRQVGVWPVTPFVTAKSISFSLYLPAAEKLHKKFLRQYFEAQTQQEFPQWQTKISLTPIILQTVEEHNRQFKMKDLNKNLIELDILNTSKIADLLEELQTGQKLAKDVMIFLFVLFKLNRFLAFYDQK